MIDDAPLPCSCCPTCHAPVPAIDAGDDMRWIQRNVALARVDGSLLPAEARLLDAIEPIVEAARAEGLERFWFVRKDPGLRLRFGGSHLPPTLAHRLDDALHALQCAGAVETSFPSVYEPEVAFLGGHACLPLVHRYFDLDTQAWLAWYAAQRSETVRLTSPVLSLAVMNDLFARCIGANEEVWDVWCNLERIYGAATSEPLHIPAIDLSMLEALGGPAMAPIARAYLRANTVFAEGLQALWSAGRLQVGRRALLPTIAAFHWNRHRVEARTVARLVGAMVRAHDPRRDLIGVEPSRPPAIASSEPTRSSGSSAASPSGAA